MKFPISLIISLALFTFGIIIILASPTTTIVMSGMLMIAIGVLIVLFSIEFPEHRAPRRTRVRKRARKRRR